MGGYIENRKCVLFGIFIIMQILNYSIIISLSRHALITA